MVTLLTTTDGEQPNDSLDLSDGPPELSPPPIASESHMEYQSQSQSNVQPPSVQLHAQSLAKTQAQTNNSPHISYANANHSVSTMNLCKNQTASIVAAESKVPPSSTTVNHCDNSDELMDSPRGTPPAPLVGAHQESRFTFSGRTPPLPDLRVTDFFSTPVRGSVDAGQPDASQLNSMLSLVASRVRKNSVCMSNGSEKSTRCNSENNDNESAKTTTHKSLKANINVTANPLDISLCAAGQTSCAQTSTASRIRSRTSGGSGSGGSRTQATIVVQQPSLSLDAPAATILLGSDEEARRHADMQHLLDVANTPTMQEIHDFEMRYGSPHHSRSQSVKTPGSRTSGRPNYLCLPPQRSRVASMPNTGVEEKYYRLRQFSITGKGIINRGDSLKSRRSRSTNSVASSNSSTEHLMASYPGSARSSAAGSLASSRESSASQEPAPYRVLMLGAPAVGKSSLVAQFMTSEFLNAYDTSIDDDSGEKTVSVRLAGEESELTFIDPPCTDMTVETSITRHEAHAYCVVYSTTDSVSARIAEQLLQTLWRGDHMSAKAVILVGNKIDLARCRLVATEEGKSMATAYDCKFIETSVGINHNVDELLVGLLTQIRLKLENPERAKDLLRKRSRKNRNRSPLDLCAESDSPKKYRGSRTSASLKVKSILGKVWARDSKSKSCENLHVL